MTFERMKIRTPARIMHSAVTKVQGREDSLKSLDYILIEFALYTVYLDVCAPVKSYDSNDAESKTEV